MRTRSSKIAGPGVAPRNEAYETSRSSGSPRKLQAPGLNRVTDRMKVSSAPTGLHRRTTNRCAKILHQSRRGDSNSYASRHDILSVACLPVSPLRVNHWRDKPCIRQVGWDGVEPPQSEDHWFTASLAHQCSPTQIKNNGALLTPVNERPVKMSTAFPTLTYRLLNAYSMPPNTLQERNVL